MDAHSESTMLSEAKSEFYTTQEDSTPLACTTDAAAGSSSSSSHYLSAQDGTGTESNSETVLLPEREIEVSKVHWSELSSKWVEPDADGREICNQEKSSREIIEEFRQLPKYRIWLKVECGFICRFCVGPEIGGGKAS